MTKVLVVGIGKPNFILPLYQELQLNLEGYRFESLNLRGYPITGKIYADQIFKKNHIWTLNENPIRILSVLFKILFSSYLWKDNFISMSELGFKYFRYFPTLIKIHLRSYLYAKFVEKINPDIIHLHFPNHKNALFIKYLNKKFLFDLIVTFWGSDIYRIKTLKTHQLQKDLLYFATKITVTTPEMQFSVLSRYGFVLKEKIVQAKFIMNNFYINETLKLLKDNNWKESFLKEFNIQQNQIKVIFGNNAFKSNNHLKFLEQLKKMQPHELKRFHIIFPLTYGDEEGTYIKEIKIVGSTIPVHITYITDFLDWGTLTKLKLISEVYIHGPVTDGLSAFLIEYFYTNNLALIGEWLPYKTFRDIGIQYKEFQDFKDIPSLFLELPQLIKTLNLNSNKTLVKEYFSEKVLVKKWIETYKNVGK